MGKAVGIVAQQNPRIFNEAAGRRVGGKVCLKWSYYSFLFNYAKLQNLFSLD
jgi:hypothetical protein